MLLFPALCQQTNYTLHHDQDRSNKRRSTGKIYQQHLMPVVSTLTGPIVRNRDLYDSKTEVGL